MLKLILLASTGTYWVWGQPLVFGGNDGGTINQAFACKSDNSRLSEDYVARDCVLIGPPTHDLGACHGVQMDMAKEDFPEHVVRFCVPIRLRDLERLTIPGK